MVLTQEQLQKDVTIGGLTELILKEGATLNTDMSINSYQLPLNEIALLNQSLGSVHVVGYAVEINEQAIDIMPHYNPLEMTIPHKNRIAGLRIYYDAIAAYRSVEPMPRPQV